MLKKGGSEGSFVVMNWLVEASFSLSLLFISCEV